MKKLFFFLLLITSTNVFSMKKVSEGDFDKLSGIAKILDRLSLNYLKAVGMRSDRALIGGAHPDVWRKYHAREDKIKLNFVHQAKEFEELQKNLFGKVICKPRVSLTGKRYYYMRGEREELERNVPSSVANNKAIKSEKCVQEIKKALEDADRTIKKVLKDTDRKIKEEQEYWDRRV